MYLQAAFEAVCKNAAEAGSGKYVCLTESIPYYGGPEEGGWWGRDRVCQAWQYFEDPAAAEAAKMAVEKLAEELTAESRKEFGESCLRQMDWLEVRGLEANYLPEVDGESEFSVCVCDEIPPPRYGTRGYS